METYVALLRGINVSGKNPMAMEALRDLFASLGHDDVRTYLQSGNVAFRSRRGDPAKIAGAIEARIARDLGLTVPVLLRTRAQIADVLGRNPFAVTRAEPATLHVTFLAALPDPAAAAALEATRSLPDACSIVGREVYLHCPDGYGRTKLNNTFLERKLGVGATTRSWKTVTKLAEL